MGKRKHVLCQKPMTHNIGEARRVAAMAGEMKVTTSLPVNNPSTDATKLISSWMGLTPPTVVSASASETYPKASIVHMDFPPHEGRPELRLSWYDGGLMPPHPAGLRKEDQRLFSPRGEGVLYAGDQGILVAGFNGDNPGVYPESAKFAPLKQPHALENRDHAIDQFIAACKRGPAPLAAFQTQSAVTEAFLLGCVAR